jgi:hypothetical protein
MEYVIESFRHGKIILEQTPEYNKTWSELKSVIESITDTEIIVKHESIDRNPMSLSQAINLLLKEKLIQHGWNEESRIFQEAPYAGDSTKRWRLDFAKESISLEVAFNHGEAIAWNLLKPVLAGELNHVKKEIDTEIGVIICATQELKEKGGFDGAVGEFEKFLTYLKPLRDLLTVPTVIVGLKAPKTFEIIRQRINGRNQGIVHKL